MANSAEKSQPQGLIAVKDVQRRCIETQRLAHGSRRCRCHSAFGRHLRGNGAGLRASGQHLHSAVEVRPQRVVAVEVALSGSLAMLAATRRASSRVG
jgi:hypothetical protein